MSQWNYLELNVFFQALFEEVSVFNCGILGTFAREPPSVDAARLGGIARWGSQVSRVSEATGCGFGDASSIDLDPLRKTCAPTLSQLIWKLQTCGKCIKQEWVTSVLKQQAFSLSQRWSLHPQSTFAWGVPLRSCPGQLRTRTCFFCILHRAFQKRQHI